MRRYVTAVAAVLSAAGFSGCLVADTSHTLYLSPDGSVAWSVLERDIRSVEGSASERDREEQALFDAIARDAHPVLEGLRLLGPDHASVSVLRPERPYTVLTEARFARLDRAIERFFLELGVPVQVAMQADPHGGTLSVSLDLSVLEHEDPARETPATALLEDLDRYRLVLTHGRFTSARGFELTEGGRAATLATLSSGVEQTAGPSTFQLEWTTGAR
jgi:hypothetical protein